MSNGDSRTAQLRRQISGLLFIVALIGAFALALQPAPELPPLYPGQDKIVHFLAFALIAVLGFEAWPHRPLTIVGLMLCYGAAMEVAQSFVPFRDGDLMDWLADALGVGLAWVVHAHIGRLRRRSPP